VYKSASGRGKWTLPSIVLGHFFLHVSWNNGFDRLVNYGLFGMVEAEPPCRRLPHRYGLSTRLTSLFGSVLK